MYVISTLTIELEYKIQGEWV